MGERTLTMQKLHSKNLALLACDNSWKKMKSMAEGVVCAHFLPFLKP